MNFWVEQYPEKRIKRIYAQTVSEQGRMLAKKLYLGPLYILGNDGITRVDDAYVLDMSEEAASKVIRKFQERRKIKEQKVTTTEIEKPIIDAFDTGYLDSRAFAPLLHMQESRYPIPSAYCSSVSSDYRGGPKRWNTSPSLTTFVHIF